jgi:peptidoglycan/xylan/chitin deacetylase (PgdA/CDA1 family)
MESLKDKIRNILLILLFLSGVPLFRLFWVKKKYKTLYRVVVFHEVKDNQVKDFQEKISLFKKKFNIVSPQDFLTRNFSSKKLNILLTFDDGFESWLSNVVPILQKENILAIFFVDKRGFDLAPKLSKEGFEIGGHTLNHPMLPQLSIDDMKRELMESKKILSQKIGKEVIFFAYPFGDAKSFNSIVKEEVKKASYRYAFTTVPGINTKKTDSYLLYRDGLKLFWNNLLSLAWFYGAYDLYDLIKRIIWRK